MNLYNAAFYTNNGIKISPCIKTLWCVQKKKNNKKAKKNKNKLK